MLRGGQNRTHARIEGTPKLDSFSVGHISGHAEVHWKSGHAVRVDVSPDTVLLQYRYQGQNIREPLAISRVLNNYGGARPFLLCPECGQRVRYLYLRRGVFRCRHCARLNYSIQQRTKNELFPYHAATKLLRERFEVPMALMPVPMDLPYFLPTRPKGMHWNTYRKLMERYGKLQRQYATVSVERLEAFIGRPVQ